MLMYHCLIKRNARSPSGDTFLARRIAGSGLASSHFYQVWLKPMFHENKLVLKQYFLKTKPEQILAALESHLEIKILTAYMEYIQNKLNEPLTLYK